MIFTKAYRFIEERLLYGPRKDTKTTLLSIKKSFTNSSLVHTYTYTIKEFLPLKYTDTLYLQPLEKTRKSHIHDYYIHSTIIYTQNIHMTMIIHITITTHMRETYKQTDRQADRQTYR